MGSLVTNEVSARSWPVMGGFEGHFRKVHRAEWERVCVNGVVQLYATADAAEVAAWRALKAHLQGEIVGDGAKADAASKAEELFGCVFKNGRKIEVERR